MHEVYKNIEKYNLGKQRKVLIVFDDMIAVSGIKNEIKQNEQLTEELHKPIIRKFKKRKVYFSFKDNIWCDDLADMQLISIYNKGIRFLL